VQLLAASPDGDNQRGFFELLQVLGDRLAGDVEMRGELAEGLPIAGPQVVEEQPALGGGKRFEDLARVGGHGSYYATFWLPVKKAHCNWENRFPNSQTVNEICGDGPCTIIATNYRIALCVV